MHLLLDSSYFPSSWSGVFYRENGERVAGVRYAESAGKGVLTLSASETTFGLGWMLICRWVNRNPEPMEW